MALTITAGSVAACGRPPHNPVAADPGSVATAHQSFGGDATSSRILDHASDLADRHRRITSRGSGTGPRTGPGPGAEAGDALLCAQCRLPVILASISKRSEVRDFVKG